jgi:mannose-6-phosphate isomerase-like protein (cupin superfamily)
MKYKKFIKPWGYELLLEKNKNYMLKKLFMKKGHRCSLQFHNKKTETLYILSGKLNIYTGSSAKKLKSKIFLPNEILTLKPKIIHRMKALSDCTYLETSTPQLLDVVRISDDYLRVK